MGCLLMDCFSQPEEVKASIADGLLSADHRLPTHQVIH